MKIGTLGSGDVGRRLGGGFVKVRGDEVMLGTRDRKKEEVLSWVKEHAPKGKAGTFDEAARFGELLVLAANWNGTENALKLAKPANTAGKVLIDATNPLKFERENAPPVLAVSGHDSAGEQVQRWLPQAKVVKCFSIAGNAHMVNPSFPKGAPTMFLGGNDEGAKDTVKGVLKDFGWTDVSDLGGIETSRYLEPSRWCGSCIRSATGSTTTWPSAWSGSERPCPSPDDLVAVVGAHSSIREADVVLVVRDAHRVSAAHPC